MRSESQGRKLLIISVIGYFCCAASVLLLPLSVSEGGEMNTAGYALALTFWIGLAVGILFFVLAWSRVKKSDDYQKLKKALKPGWAGFFSGKAATAADILFLIALAVTIAGNSAAGVPYMVTLAGMFLLIFTFCMHFILNGRVWKASYGDVKKLSEESRSSE